MVCSKRQQSLSHEPSPFSLSMKVSGEVYSVAFFFHTSGSMADINQSEE
jgi:hypothetical protein